jgi:hypothetical protein
VQVALDPPGWNPSFWVHDTGERTQSRCFICEANGIISVYSRCEFSMAFSPVSSTQAQCLQENVSGRDSLKIWNGVSICPPLPSQSVTRTKARARITGQMWEALAVKVVCKMLSQLSVTLCWEGTPPHRTQDEVQGWSLLGDSSQGDCRS